MSRLSVPFVYLLLIAFNPLLYGQVTLSESILSGSVSIDSTWSKTVYMSYLPSFEDVYTMSSEMIIGEAEIESNGNFEFDLDILPNEDKVYRLHIPKLSDSKYSLMIGRNKNYLLVVANKNSKIKLYSNSGMYPFQNVTFKEDKLNKEFHNITNIINRRDSIASGSDYYRRKFIRDRVKDELLTIADTSMNDLVSFYAIFKSDFETDYNKNKALYNAYLKKWSGTNNEYFKDLRSKISNEDTSKASILKFIPYIVVFILGLVLGKFLPKRKNKLAQLSVQERKILDALKAGKSNKEISEEFNIGISTVKTHVSRILSKLKVKSRKDLMDN